MFNGSPKLYYHHTELIEKCGYIKWDLLDLNPVQIEFKNFTESDVLASKYNSTPNKTSFFRLDYVPMKYLKDDGSINIVYILKGNEQLIKDLIC